MATDDDSRAEKQHCDVGPCSESNKVSYGLHYKGVLVRLLGNSWTALTEGTGLQNPSICRFIWVRQLTPTTQRRSGSQWIMESLTKRELVR